MSKKLAIIGSGRMAWIMSRNAHEMGIETHCFSNIEPDFIRDEVDCFYNISIFEKDEIATICKKVGIDGVIATTELTISVAAYIASKLGLPGIPVDDAKIITDKYRNRALCSGIQDISQIKFWKICNAENVNTNIYPLPIIIKPTGKGGKRGITVVTTREEILPAVKYARDNSLGDPIIIEEYISEGKEFSVEALSYAGHHYIIQITEKISSGPPHCVELGHHQPAELSLVIKNKICEVVSLGLTAIGANNTSSHTEIKVVGDKIYIIEFNIRPGGDHIAWPLTELSTGYNMIKGAIQIAMDEFVGIDTANFKNNYAGVYFVTKQTERLKPIFDKCEEYDWLYHKNFVSETLQSLEHNDCYSTNSMIYFSKRNRINL